MKKLITISALAVLVALAGAAYASSDTKDVGVLLTVDPVFSLTLGDAVIDMGSVAEGNAGSGGTIAYCATNQGNFWTLQIESSTIVGGSTLAEIPLSNFTFQSYAVADSDGNPSIGYFRNTYSALTSNQLAFLPDGSEYSDTDCRVGIALVLNVPYGQQADTYAATVTLTMVGY